MTAGDPPRHGARPVSGDARGPAGRAGGTRFAALRDVDLQIGHGETVAVVGKSGSGRSTPMHLLALVVVTHDEDLGFAQGAVGGVWTSS